MKKHLFLITALLLTVTLVTSCGKDKPDTSKKGLYVGIIGFNKTLNTNKLQILNDYSKEEMTRFINKLTSDNGTILYHAVNTALDQIESIKAPEDLINVSIITFTDGQDQGSYDWNPNYGSGPEYVSAINKRIKQLYIGENQVPVSAYAIGVRGVDVADEEQFRQDLAKLSSDPQHNVFLVNNMSQVGDIFSDIAQDLYHQSSSWDVTLKISAPEPNSRIRFTFDKVNAAEDSQLFVEGIYTTENNVSAFSVLNYHGVQDCGSVIYLDTDPDHLKILTFHNLLTTYGSPVTADNAKMWKKVNGNWQQNSEFTQGADVTVHEEYKSALIMMVLDCSSSLGSDFASVQSAAKQFIETLYGNTHQGN